MPSRRRVLRAGSVAAALALAGCSSRTTTGTPPTDSPTPTPAPSPSPTPSPTPTPDRLAFGGVYDSTDGDTVTATDARVQSSVRRLDNVDHNAIEAGPYWYLFITVEAMPDGPLPRDFRFRTADGRYDPLAVRDERRREQIEFVNGEAYRGAGGTTDGWLLFEVPYDDPAEDARLALDGAATWTVPDATVRRLRADPPDFEVRGIETPERPPADEPFDVRLTVANGGGSGTFRGAFNYTAPLYAPQGIVRQIDAGAEQTFAVEIDIHTGDGARTGDAVAARLVSADETHTWSVTLG